MTTTTPAGEGGLYSLVARVIHDAGDIILGLDAMRGNELTPTRSAARVLGVTPRAIRFYCQQGLVTPVERPAVRFGTDRMFGPAAMARLQLVVHLREIDMPLRDICALFAEIGKPQDEQAKFAAVAAMIDAALARRMTEIYRAQAAVRRWNDAANWLWRRGRHGEKTEAAS